MNFLRKSHNSEGEKSADLKVTREMQKASLEDSRAIKLLILGAGGSGKTTLRKQFSRLYNAGFADDKSRSECRVIIFHNLVDGMKATLGAVQRICPGELASPEAAEVIVGLADDYDFREKLGEVVEAFKTLFGDPGVMRVLATHRSEFQVQECFPHYFERLASDYPAWGGPDWIPSVDDCVRSRVRSSGIIEVDFEMENVLFRVFDAGGQRAERRKWIHSFEGVTALIYVASLTEYDEVLFEDPEKNRLEETLEVWEGLVNNSHFVHTPVLLFLNKMDLFTEKLARVGLNVTGLFPSAPGEAGIPVEDAVAWFAQEFKARRGQSDPKLLFVHTMSAVDSDKVNDVFLDVKKILLRQALVGAGLTGL